MTAPELPLAPATDRRALAAALLDRRRFLLAAAAAAATPALTRPGAAAAASGRASASGPVSLPEFLDLSRLLTDVGDLDEAAGAQFLGALRSDPTLSAGLDRLVAVGLRAPQPPRDFAALVATGVLREAAASQAALGVVTAWYTGKVGDQVVTYLGALAWTTLERFAEPASVCLGFGHWADRP